MRLTSYKDQNTFRVVRDIDRYAIVHPGHPVPFNWDCLGDYSTFGSAEGYANDCMDSDRMIEEIGNDDAKQATFDATMTATMQDLECNP